MSGAGTLTCAGMHLVVISLIGDWTRTNGVVAAVRFRRQVQPALLVLVRVVHLDVALCDESGHRATFATQDCLLKTIPSL